MELIKANPFDLQKNSWNSNVVDRDNFEKLKKSIERVGSFKPIIVREVGTKFEILGGYHRNEAAKELGLKEVEALNLGVISEQQAKEISIIDNTRYGTDDSKLLEDLINSMDAESLSLVMPDIELDIEIVEMEDSTPDDMIESSMGESEHGIKVLKFRYEDLDKADEVEDALLKIAKDKDLYYKDGYANLSEALYEALKAKDK